MSEPASKRKEATITAIGDRSKHGRCMGYVEQQASPLVVFHHDSTMTDKDETATEAKKTAVRYREVIKSDSVGLDIERRKVIRNFTG